MDIGDPSEIPATRKKLPSMQELGAFDVVSSGPALADAPANQAAPPSPAVETQATSPSPPAEMPTVATGNGLTPRVPPTPEQLRQALAKADPATRRRLLRLIAGGQSVQQIADPATVGGGPRRSLVMQRNIEQHAGTRGNHARPSAPPSPQSPPPRRTTAPPSANPAPRARDGNKALLQIDENTELLDAASPQPGSTDRRVDIQAQVDAALQRDTPRPDPTAHKVLFPTYDPAQHGEDVRSLSSRRKDAPVEGHFPAPRQPFQASYRHPDGRPMTPEENKVEEVLQATRCEETLSVLARDGVNGLLLSPRDLDAAVASGLLPAETAATLWKTWAALRPVIHVIEDVQAVAVEADAEASPDPATPGAQVPTDGPTAQVPHAATGPITPSNTASVQMGEPTADLSVALPTVAAMPETALASLAVAPPARVPVEAMPPVDEAPASPASDADDEPVTQPMRRFDPNSARPADAAPATPLSTPGLRLRALLRTVAWIFVAVCVVNTTGRLAMLAWLRWGHLWTAS